MFEKHVGVGVGWGDSLVSKVLNAPPHPKETKQVEVAGKGAKRERTERMWQSRAPALRQALC